MRCRADDLATDGAHLPLFNILRIVQRLAALETGLAGVAVVFAAVGAFDHGGSFPAKTSLTIGMVSGML